MKLSEAEVVVTTQKQLEQETHKGDWFHLSDYGDTGEFYQACYSYFLEESNPDFRYPAWENIPDALITKEWFSPNFFELRDAFERIDEPEIDYFLSWCKYHGYNIACDDPHLLVSHYQESNPCYNEQETELPDIPEELFPYPYLSIASEGIYNDRYSTEVFDDNYD